MTTSTKEMIYTSCYSNIKNAPRDAYLVRISVTQPEWAQTQDALPVLYPEPSLLWDYKNGDVTENEYARRYLASLDLLAKRILADLEQVKIRACGRPVVLLCWCGKGKFCHRKLFAQWYENKTRETIKEL